MSTAKNDGVYGQEKLASGNSELNALDFLMKQILGRMNVGTLVKVMAIHGPSSLDSIQPVGFVDVLPLVNQIDGAGNPTPHTTVYNIPFFRSQAGSNAFIVDPEPGDIGFCVFADRDQSSVKSVLAPANPGSYRRFDFADGFYFGSWMHGSAPVRFTIITDDGIRIEGDQLLRTHADSIKHTAKTVDTKADEKVTTEVPEFDVTSENTNLTSTATTTINALLLNLDAETIGGISQDLGLQSTRANIQIRDEATVNIGNLNLRTNGVVHETDSYEVIVPEFVINGDLHVTGILHCTWEGDNVAVGYGGTGADLSATGGPNNVVMQETLGGPFTVKPLGTATVEWRTQVVLSGTFSTNQAFHSKGGVAYPVYSTDVDVPIVDGITLDSGHMGDTIWAATLQGYPFQTPLAVSGSNGDPLYLNTNGKLSTEMPSSGWVAPLGTLDATNKFLFYPLNPVLIA